MVVGVVDESDVHTVDAQAFEALLERTERAVERKVEDRCERRCSGEGLVRLLAFPKQPPDLRREDELVARALLQGRPDSALREAEAVERGGVEEADTPFPRTIDDR